MWPTVTDQVAWSVSPSLCWSVTVVNPAKMVESIDMPFGLRSRVGPRNQVLNAGPDLFMGGVILNREVVAHYKV